MKSPSQYWQLLKQEAGEHLRIFSLRFDTYFNRRNKTELRATVLTSNDAVNVLAITADEEIIFVKQYRFGTQEETIELPGGFVDDGEDRQKAAARELLEETGYSGSDWTYMGYCDNNPAYMDSRIYHYLLRNAKASKKTLQLDEGENIEVLKMNKDALQQLLTNNAITHPHTISALAKVFNIYRKENL